MIRNIRALHTALIEYLEARPFLTIDESVVTTAAQAIVGSADDPIIPELVDWVLHFGPLTNLLNDPSITEIMVNGLGYLYVERAGVLSRMPNPFKEEAELMDVINKIVSQIGRRVDTSNPLVDARLPDGSRVNVVIPPLSLLGPVLTIRKFPQTRPDLAQLVEWGSLTESAAEFLQTAIQQKHNLVIAGGTGSGKTTLLNALASCIPYAERVVTIEDSAEMHITHPHVVGLEARMPNLEGLGEITTRMLLKNALRMRPDRIIIGEVRGSEALDMIQAMITGHPGSFTTVHATSPVEAFHRIQTMALTSGIGLSETVIREQLSLAIQLVIQQARLSSGRRKVTGIYSQNALEFKAIYRYNENIQALEQV